MCRIAQTIWRNAAKLSLQVIEVVPMVNATAPLSPGRVIWRDLLVLAAIGAGFWVAHLLGRIVLVLILAMFFAYVIAPLVALAQHPLVFRGRSRGLPRAAAIASVYLVLAGGVASSAAILWPSAAEQVDEAIVSAPKYAESFRV